MLGDCRYLVTSTSRYFREHISCIPLAAYSRGNMPKRQRASKAAASPSKKEAKVEKVVEEKEQAEEPGDGLHRCCSKVVNLLHVVQLDWRMAFIPMCIRVS